MIALFSILFSLSAALIVACLFGIRKLDRQYIFSLRMTLISAFMITLCQIAIINTSNERVASFSYSVFFIFIDILLLSVFDFSRKYSKYRVRLPWFNWVLVIGGILDCSSSFLNFFFGHSFDLIKVGVPSWWDEPAREVYKIIIKWPHGVHIFACYFVVLLLIIVFAIRIVTTPKMYRLMHTNLFFSVLVPVVGESFFIFSGSPVDFSIVFFSVAAILLCLYTVRVTPNRLIMKQLQSVVSNMVDSVIVFDIDGEMVYKNSSMEDFFRKYEAIGLNPHGPFKSIAESDSYKKLKTMPDRDFDEEVSTKDKTYTFHISIRSIRDEKNVFLGAFFIIHDKTEEMDKLNQERYLAVHDKLTGLYNREGFFEKVRSVIINDPDEKYLMVCFDLDNFKIVNDLFGRETGDELLVRISEGLKYHSEKLSVTGRLGGDRFAAVIRKADFVPENFINYSNQISYITENLFYPIIFHIGVYEIEDISTPVSVMTDRAFMAINTIKGNLQTKVAYYNSDLRKDIVREQQLIGEFSSALASEQFQMYLQPQVSIDGNVYGAEALVRWKHPKEGVMRPSEFISIFEQKGLITTLDSFMWNLAAQKLQNWKKRGLDNLYISVNISPKDFVYTDIYKTFTELVKKYDINPRNLKLEITESGILINFEKTLNLIKSLREFGFQIEIDDFGSGYSSLNLLKDVPFDVLKIDMAFLQDSENQDRSLQILNSIISMSKRLNMPVITEGVETKEQVEFLKDMGTDFYQGFYFARPMPISEFEATYIK